MEVLYLKLFAILFLVLHSFYFNILFTEIEWKHEWFPSYPRFYFTPQRQRNIMDKIAKDLNILSPKYFSLPFLCFFLNSQEIGENFHQKISKEKELIIFCLKTTLLYFIL